MAAPLDLILLLDVDLRVAEGELDELLPPNRRETKYLRLSEMTGLAPAAGKREAIDWEAQAAGVERLVEAARRAKAATDRNVEVFVAGRAPLPLFVQLGYALTRFNASPMAAVDVGGRQEIPAEAEDPPISLLNPYRGQHWERYVLRSSGVPLAAASGGPVPDGKFGAPEPLPFFDAVSGIEPNDAATGSVALFVSTIGGGAPRAAIQRALGDRLVGIVEISTKGAADLRPDAFRRVAAELARKFSEAANKHPNATEFALFVGGPATLAFLCGTACNPTVFGGASGRRIRVGHYQAPVYELVLSLPYEPAGPRPLDRAPEEGALRKEVLFDLIEGIDELRGALREEDFPARIDRGVIRTWLAVLKDLRFDREPTRDEYSFRLTGGRLGVGERLLEALRPLPQERRRRIAQLTLLRELFCDEQGLPSSGYRDSPAAGAAVETLDLAADGVVLFVLTSLLLRRGGEQAIERSHEIATALVEATLDCMAALDRDEHDQPRRRLSERRLRRYLTLHLQSERAQAWRCRGLTERERKSSINRLFGERLLVEVVPTRGEIDSHFDRLVAGAPETADLVALFGERLLRWSRRPLAAARLVEAVGALGDDREGIRVAVRSLFEEHRSILRPGPPTAE